MNDRELLELAAKAAGFKALPTDDRASDASVFMDAGEGRKGAWWNPLIDDGQALRLSVRLSIDPCQVPHFYCVEAWYSVGGGEPDTIKQEYMGDAFAATRRAIVRAAAKIGEAMTDHPLSGK